MSERETIALPGGYWLEPQNYGELYSIQHRTGPLEVVAIAEDVPAEYAREFAAALASSTQPEAAGRADDQNLRDLLAALNECKTVTDYLTVSKTVEAMLAAAPQPALPAVEAVDPEAFVLPCDVWLPPSTRITKGCTLSALIASLNQRARSKIWPAEMSDAAVAKMAALPVVDASGDVDGALKEVEDLLDQAIEKGSANFRAWPNGSWGQTYASEAREALLTAIRALANPSATRRQEDAGAGFAEEPVGSEGLVNEIPADVFDFYDRKAKNLSNLWANATPAARQAILVGLLKAWKSGHARGLEIFKELSEQPTDKAGAAVGGTK